ncbi:MAG: MFS transporter [Pseudomonadota bacterium]|nr:MFS transporter [Pseudomonadota bacterium]
MTQFISATRTESGLIRTWLAIVVLGVGAFSIVSTELAPIGLLTPIAGDLGRSEAAIGLTVTAYAWIGAVSALLSTLWLGKIPRKPLMIGLMLGLAISNGVAMASNAFPMLLGARVIGAVFHGLFWAMIGALAAQIAPARHVGLATSIVFGGVSAASVLGVPLAALIGQSEGWRVSFGAIGTLCFAAALAMAALIPSVEAEAPVGRQALTEVLRRGDLRGIYLATAFAVTAHFAAFTFIEPFLSTTAYVSGSMVAIMLFSFGAAGLIGNVLTGFFIDKYLKPVLALALIAMSTALIGLALFGEGLAVGALMAMVVLWGAAIAIIFVGFQAWILRIAGEAALPASAIYVSIFNAAIGTGAMVGAWILSHAGLLGLLGLAGAGGVISIGLIALCKAPSRSES